MLLAANGATLADEDGRILLWDGIGAKFSAAEGGATCSLCHAGSFANSTGASTCTLCQEGTFNPIKGRSSPSACEICEAGSYSDSPGVATCTLCHPGSFNPFNGSTSLCTLCPKGTFNPSNASKFSSDCALCDARSYGNVLGLAGCPLCDAGSCHTVTAILVVAHHAPIVWQQLTIPPKEAHL
jgi:hypothetical protein